MKAKTNLTRYTLLSALICSTATQAQENKYDILDPVDVTDTSLQPAMSPVKTEKMTFGRESADILRDIPGVSGSRMGGHGTDPTIRGLSQTQINVLLDGAYVHGGCPNRMDPPTAYAPVGTYEEVTVIKGMQTLEYGGGGPGGTILFERVTERFENDESIRADFEAGYRGNHNTKEVGVDVAAGNQLGFARFIASHTDADSYEDGNGNEVRSAYEETSKTLILGYTPSDDTRFEVSYEQMRTEDLLFPGAGMDSPKADNDTIRAKFNTTEAFGPFQAFKAEVYQSEVEHVMDNYTLRDKNPMMPKMRAPSTSDTLGGRVIGELDSSIGRWKMGIDVQNNERDAERINDTAGAINSVMWPGVDIKQAGIFAELNHQLNKNNRIITGLRYDHVTSDASRADIDPPMMPLSPNALYAIYYDGAQAKKVTDNNIGGLFRFEHDLTGTSTTLYGAISRSVRTPDATERYIASNGMTPGARWVGNPTLDSEKHHQIEIGAQTVIAGWDMEASIYYNDVSDYVLRDRFIAPGNNATIYRNIDATLIGGEINLTRQFNNNWSSSFGIGYVHAENDTDGRAIAQTPPLEGIVSIDYKNADWKLGSRIRAAAKQSRVDTQSQTGIDGQGLDFDKTAGWGVLDFYGNYFFNDKVSIDFGVDNIFDKNYAQHLNREDASSGDQFRVNEPGRSAWLKVSASF